MGVVRGIVAMVGACVLAACGEGLPGQAVSEAQLPHPRAGLWRWTSQATGIREVCFSGRVLTAFAAKPGCTVTRRERTADGGFVVETECGGKAGRLSARARGDFDRAFSTDVAVANVRDHAEYRYLGPCAPGQRADDAP